MEITISHTYLHPCRITMHNYMVWYNITRDPRDSDPATINYMCQKECVKRKEITRVKIHGTLLDRT